MRISAQPAPISTQISNDTDIKRKQMEQAAAQFEGIFISQILKESMPDGEDGDAELLGKSNSMDIFKGMLNEAMGEEMAKSGAFGIKEMLMNQYRDIYAKAGSASIPSAKQAEIIGGRYTISSGFGFRSDPISRENSFHYGVDLAAAEGTEVRSPVNGTVYSAENEKGYGNCIKIRDDDGRLLVFGHLKEMMVKAGDTIRPGDKIGEVGSSGRSTGPHLHLEVRDSENRAIDPAGIFALKKNDKYAQRRQE